MKHCTPLSIALGAFFDEIRRTTLVNGKILSIHEVSRITRMGESTYMRLKKGFRQYLEFLQNLLSVCKCIERRP